MSNTTKLDHRQKHVLRLIARDKKADGWTPVSAFLFKTLSETTPPELATFEQIGDAGAGRARLTEAGQGVIDALAWL